MKKYEKIVLLYLQERDWDNPRPGDIAKSISIEASELLEHFQWTNPSLKEIKKDTAKLEEVKKELADILIYCFSMSALLGFDTGKILLNKLENARQKYPAHLFKNKAKKKGSTNSDAYWKIKKAHRMKGE